MWSRLVFLSLFICSLLPLFSQNSMSKFSFDSSWKKVERLENELRTKDALETILEIEAQCKSEADFEHKIKCIIYRAKYNQILIEDDVLALEKEFKTGDHLLLKHRGVGIVRLFLAEVKKGESFTACTNFFGAKIHYTRSMKEKPKGLLITYTMTITGPLKFFWYLMMKNKLVDCMPHDVDKLVEVSHKQN